MLTNSTSFKIRIILFTIGLCLPFFVFSQAKKPGSIEYLKLCNGFKQISLGTDIYMLPGNNLTFLDGEYKVDADSCVKYEYKDFDLLKMGDNLTLNLIGFRTFKNKIVNIYLFFKRADGYKVLSNFISTYGVFTERPDSYMDIYNWNSSKVTLSLRYELKLDYGVAIFTSKSVEQEIETMKEIKAMKKMEALQASFQKMSLQY
jgi:hypothetical protein